MDLEDAIAAGGEPLIARWLDRALMYALPESEDDDHEQWAFKLAAARAAVEAVAGPEAPVAARMQAVLTVVAHMAAIEQQARANSRYLDPKTRQTSQRFAVQLMNLASRQLAVLERSKTGKSRRQAAETAETGPPRGTPARPAPPEPRPTPRAPESPAMDPPPPEPPAAPPEPAPNRRMRRAAARAARRAISE